MTSAARADHLECFVHNYSFVGLREAGRKSKSFGKTLEKSSHHLRLCGAMERKPTMESPFICDLTAIDAEQRERHRVAAQHIHSAVQEVREISDGYAFRLPVEPSTVLLAAEFLTLERLCCPFLTLVLEVECERGPLWLKLTGREEVK
jgi:hypothetical protein